VKIRFVRTETKTWHQSDSRNKTRPGTKFQKITGNIRPGGSHEKKDDVEKKERKYEPTIERGNTDAVFRKNGTANWET